MFSSSWTTMYNAFVDESYCEEEPSATRHTPKAAPGAADPIPVSNFPATRVAQFLNGFLQISSLKAAGGGLREGDLSGVLAEL
jgi:hypothetical protein